MEAELKDKPPFNTGDLVQFRASQLKTQSYRKYRNDIGLVLAIRKSTHSSKKWLCKIYMTQNCATLEIFHSRIKKCR